MVDALGIYTAVAVPAVVLILLFTLVTGAPPMPSPPQTHDPILELIPEDLEGVALELGSGWGSLALDIAQRRPKLRVRGIELSPVPLLFSVLRPDRWGQSNLRLELGDFNRADFGEGVKVVVVYLTPGNLAKLRPKLAQLPAGTLVISNTFAVPGWEPAEERRAPRGNYPVYLYRLPQAFKGD